MNKKVSEKDSDDKSKTPITNNNTNNINATVPVQYPPMNMFIPPPGFAMVPPGYPYYAPAPW